MFIMQQRKLSEYAQLESIFLAGKSAIKESVALEWTSLNGYSDATDTDVCDVTHPFAESAERGWK